MLSEYSLRVKERENVVRAVGTRERILAAARAVMLKKGLVRATTKEIARAADVSEGTLYNHFASKEQLFLAALRFQPSGFFSLMGELPQRAGVTSVSATLAEVAWSALAFYGDAIPMGASFFADPELLARQRELLREHGAGPQRANEAVAAYLRDEQKRGRVRAEADPDAVAYMLLGAVYQYVYWREFLGSANKPEADESFISGLLESIDRILLPDPPPA
jgi:AcrR family transcriptional regulator